MRLKTWLMSVVHWLALSVCILSAVSFGSAAQQRLERSTAEVYDSSLHRFQTMDQVQRHLAQMPASTDLQRVFNLENFLSARFYYGYARYSFRENWVAWLAARTINPDLDAKTDANDIIQSPWASCSQQAIVVQEMLRRMNLPYASVLFPRHFAAAVQIDRIWYVVDPWEPLERDRSRLYPLADWQSSAARAKFFSPAARAVWDADLVAHPPYLAHVNQTPAPTMAWFHPLTKVLSKWLWVPTLLWLILSARAAMRNLIPPTSTSRRRMVLA